MKRTMTMKRTTIETVLDDTTLIGNGSRGVTLPTVSSVRVQTSSMVRMRVGM